MADTTSLTDLRQRSKGASEFVSLADAVNSIRAAGRLPSSVSDTSILGYANMVTGEDQAALAAWQNRSSDPKSWRDEVGRMGFELGTMVADIKNRNGGVRPSAEALAAADGTDRTWRDYTDKLSSQKPAPAAKPPEAYASVDDIADGLSALGKIPDFAPRPYVVGFAYGLLNSAPDFHKAWVGYDEDPKPFEDLMPTAARALSSEIARIQAGPSQASPALPATTRQLGRLSEKDWQNFQQDFADATGRSGA